MNSFECITSTKILWSACWWRALKMKVKSTEWTLKPIRDLSKGLIMFEEFLYVLFKYGPRLPDCRHLNVNWHTHTHKYARRVPGAFQWVVVLSKRAFDTPKSTPTTQNTKIYIIHRTVLMTWHSGTHGAHDTEPKPEPELAHIALT